MDNYSKVLTFFMENGVKLTNEQLEALQEEFLEEGALKEKLRKKKLEKESESRIEQYKQEYAEKQKNRNPEEEANRKKALMNALSIAKEELNNLKKDPELKESFSSASGHYGVGIFPSTYWNEDFSAGYLEDFLDKSDNSIEIGSGNAEDGFDESKYGDYADNIINAIYDKLAPNINKKLKEGKVTIDGSKRNVIIIYEL